MVGTFGNQKERNLNLLLGGNAARQPDLFRIFDFVNSGALVGMREFRQSCSCRRTPGEKELI